MSRLAYLIFPGLILAAMLTLVRHLELGEVPDAVIVTPLVISVILAVVIIAKMLYDDIRGG